LLSPGAPVLPAGGCGNAIIKSGTASKMKATIGQKPKRFILSSSVDWSYPRDSIDIVRAHEYRNRRQICAFRRDVPRASVELPRLQI
jgi:hypothetical protein